MNQIQILLNKLMLSNQNKTNLLSTVIPNLSEAAFYYHFTLNVQPQSSAN